MASPILDSLLAECLQNYERSERLLEREAQLQREAQFERDAQRCLAKLRKAVRSDGNTKYEVIRTWDGQLWYAMITKEQWKDMKRNGGIWDSCICWVSCVS